MQISEEKKKNIYMAEPMMNKDEENELIDKVGADEEEEETNTSLVGGLNLVLILSFLSLSAEERLSLDETTLHEIRDNYSHKTKNCGSRSDLRTRRREMSQFPAMERQTSKVHTKIRDCRYTPTFI